MAFWLLAAITVIATLVPNGLRPRTGHVVAERFAAFFALGAALTLACPKRPIFAFCAVALTAAGLEAAQTLAPGRHARVLDAVEKVAGAAAGAVAASVALTISERFRGGPGSAGAANWSGG